MIVIVIVIVIVIEIAIGIGIGIAIAIGIGIATGIAIEYPNAPLPSSPFSIPLPMLIPNVRAPWNTTGDKTYCFRVESKREILVKGSRFPEQEAEVRGELSAKTSTITGIYMIIMSVIKITIFT